MPKSSSVVSPSPAGPNSGWAVAWALLLGAVIAPGWAGAQESPPALPVPLPPPPAIREPVVKPLVNPGPAPCVETSADSGKRQALSPLRLGIGIPLVALGGVAMILGATHMAVPLFVSPSDRPDVVMNGCMQHGVYVPCVADRYPVGGLLFGLGGAAVLAGGSVLARWPW